MKLSPILDKLIVEPDRDIGEVKTAGGIIKPSTRRELGMFAGTVLAVGPKVKEDIKAGDRIFFDDHFCGQEITFAGNKKILIMREEEVLAVDKV